MRRATFKRWDTINEAWVPAIGFFHKFGQSYVEFESGPGPYPIGICEDQEGQVHTCSADEIKFLDPPTLSQQVSQEPVEIKLPS